ncbi:autotransporter outer membrane beta-barrel domain-containing protein [Polynucleobacter ibericus]|uniref:autotransporter outer membrane beta-barrel domain-containing protein n=1 Tax=Polynucleobacter ibericus TaxID=1819725 RepID=UPI001BFD5AA0|nr:autotransporter outer membrane beta-barrel domain-containing protein [Polynucleobacter ibericus]QWE07867.1 autotransporter outer membrane beta-barrel domain-containing protein [Polynucleobacter ibericus]
MTLSFKRPLLAITLGIYCFNAGAATYYSNSGAISLDVNNNGIANTNLSSSISPNSAISISWASKTGSGILFRLYSSSSGATAPLLNLSTSTSGVSQTTNSLTTTYFQLSSNPANGSSITGICIYDTADGSCGGSGGGGGGGGGSSSVSSANTQASVANTTQALQGTYALQNSVLANGFSYDCTVFGANNVCVSGGARNTAVSAENGLNNTSALLIAAYRALPSVRIGAYADQNLSVNNGGSTVNLGNNTPLIGLFAAWNERQDGTGSELKVSAAYGQKNTTINRGVVGSGATASEAGSGSSQLNSQGFQVLGKHGFGVMQDVVVSPYVGIRYTQNNMGGYTEGSSASVTTPLTYSALNTNATTALAGVGASYRGIPQTNLFASAGVESDTNTASGSYTATWAGTGTLAPVNFNANPVKTRATATVGATYDVEKNQRLGITGIYRQESYQAVSTSTVMATYTVGF